jgi:hypothetical protein
MKLLPSIFLPLFLLLSGAGFSQVPLLNSFPSASATIFLDFDGQYVTGTVWNWSGPIDAQPSGMTTAGITEIFNRVAEDYRPFDLNITTDSTVYWAAPANKRQRIIITPTYSWYGRAGGVSFVGSFTWGDNTPSWVFSGLLSYSPKYVAEAVSHEAGHTLGLQHQSLYDTTGVKIAEYNPGQGSGEIGWAPIMGAGYNENFTTWHIGSSTIGVDIIQNDFAVISTQNGFGLKPDDHSNTIAGATPINVVAGSFATSGLINTTSDVDVFTFNNPTPAHFVLNAIPQNVGTADNGANIDIKVTLMNNTDTIGVYNPLTLLNAGIDTNLNAGTYYLVVDGVANIYHNGMGSMGLYNLSGTMASLLPIHQFQLTGSVDNNNLQHLSWDYQTDESIQQLLIERSADGAHFQPLAIVNPASYSYSYSAPAGSDFSYRLKAVTAGNLMEYYSNTIVLHNRNLAGPVLALPQQGTGNILVRSSITADFRVYNANGQQLASGRLQPGNTNINVGAARGLMILYYTSGNQQNAQKFLKQ